MIAIINRGQPKKSEEHDRVYDVMVNDKFITCFIHNRIDGLAVCLGKASKAVDRQADMDVLALMERR